MFQYNWGIVPHRTPLHVVIGRPIPVTQVHRKSPPLVGVPHLNTVSPTTIQCAPPAPPGQRPQPGGDRVPAPGLRGGPRPAVQGEQPPVWLPGGTAGHRLNWMEDIIEKYT